MDVGFVDHHDGTFGFVLDEVFDVGMRRERAGGIVGIANVEDSGVRRGGDHGLDVVRISLGERNFDHTGAGVGTDHRASFVTWIGADVASLWRGESDDREAQRRAGAGERMDVFRLESFLLRKSMDEFVGQVVEVTPAERDDGGNCVTRRLAGAERILVGVNHHGVFGERPVTSRCGKHWFGDDLESCGGG